MSLQSAIAVFVEANPSIAKKDFLKMVGEHFSEAKGDFKKKNKKKSSSDSDAPAKPLNAYQVFVKEQMVKLKDEGSSATGKELMKEIGVLWKAHKAESASNSEAETEIVISEEKNKKKSSKSSDETPKEEAKSTGGFKGGVAKKKNKAKSSEKEGSEEE